MALTASSLSKPTNPGWHRRAISGRCKPLVAERLFCRRTAACLSRLIPWVAWIPSRNPTETKSLWLTPTVIWPPLRHSNGRQFSLAYNALGRVTSLTDSAGQTVQYSYDATGEHLLSVVTPGNVTTSYAYVPATGTAADNALQTITLPDGTHQSFSYDNLGRLVGMSQNVVGEQFGIAYDTLGGIYVTNAVVALTGLHLEDRGQIRQITDPIGHTTTGDYDTNYNVVGITYPAGQVSTLGYNTNGNATEFE